MSIFNSLKIYQTKYQQAGEDRNFTQEEIEAVASATVVWGEYGKSCCFSMKGGGCAFIPMSNDSIADVGTTVDLTKAKLRHLVKEGEPDIDRVVF